MKTLLGLALLGLSANALAIVNGVEIDPALRPEIVQVETSKGHCAGVVVGERAVLTAASCTYNATDIRLPASGVELRSYVSSLYPGRPHDLAVLVADERLGLTPTSVGKTPPLGAVIELAGYGCADPQKASGAGVLRAGTSAIAAIGVQQHFDFKTDDPKGAFACYGDSGGPAFAGGKVVGVIAFGNLHGATYSIRLDIAESRSLMLDVIRQEKLDICGVNVQCP